jgi:outer membrane protein assembly factor BamB
MSETISSPADVTESPAATAPPRPRIWPGIALVVLMWLLIRGTALVAPGTMMQFMAMYWGPMLATLLLGVWWIFFSRVPLADRLLALLGFVAAAVGTYFLGHGTFREGMGVGLVIYGLPIVLTVGVVWLAITPSVGRGLRLGGLLAVLALAWGYNALLRFDGIDGEFNAAFAWRWSPTAEDRFRAEREGKAEPKPVAVAADAPKLTARPGDWVGFRGPERDGRLTGFRVATDWKAKPPELLWKHRVGPGWSSFAVVGDRIFTQEQRDDDEVVVCYAADTGEEVWVHKDQTRFTELVAGPGPRATPTFHDGRIYSLGANGKLNCLDAAGGNEVWSRDVAAESGAKVPIWGFSASPLIVQGIVTVFAGGPDGKGVMAYDAATGSPAWAAGGGSHSYSSTHRATINGVEQVLVVTDEGLSSFEPKSGTVLWNHEWPVPKGMSRVLQPTMLNDSEMLVGTWMGVGTRRLRSAARARGGRRRRFGPPRSSTPTTATSWFTAATSSASTTASSAA